MDLENALVCALLFIIVAAILLFISMIAMREKSYEEALVEQRKLTSNLLGSTRSKPKEKKQKKVGKKVKEKPSVVENNVKTAEESNSAKVLHHSESSSSSKPRVEFEEPAVVDTTHSTNVKKRTKKDKVKPILLNKEKVPVLNVDTSKNQVVNHFEKIHPKDEFELLQSLSHKEDIPVKQEKHEVDAKANKTNKTKHLEKDTNEQKAQKTGSKDKKHPQPNQQQQVVEKPPAVVENKPAVVEKQPAIVKKEIVAKSAPSTQTSNIISNNPTNSIKEKKKKKSEFNTLQQMTASGKHDVNVSLLVPLVRKADLSRSEIQILIDLLLNKQHEAPTVIDEWCEGRADPVQKLKRQLADKERALAEEQEACASAQAKLREVRAEFNAERSRLLQNYRNLEENLQAKHTEQQSFTARLHTQTQKLQQMQAQINEGVMTSHKLREELNAMQLQRKQLDIHLNQKQEAEASFQSQLSQLRNELQEQQNLNAQLNMELRNVRESSHAEKEILHERVRQIENQARQLEESRRAYNELEHRLHCTEAELSVRCQQQREELLRLEAGQAKALEDSAKFQSEVARLNHLHKQQQDEHRRIITELQTQVLTLQTEKSQLEAANEAATEDKNKEIEILNLQNELASLRVHLQQRETQLTAEIEEVTKSVQEAEAELKSQREKNDDLRKKNWKMVEALNTAESALRNKQTVTVNDSDANILKIKSEEQEKNRNFIQRLFPEVKLSSDIDNWMPEAENVIRKYVSDLRTESEKKDLNTSADVERLQSQIAQYVNIIEDTEGMLNKLQSYVEREEINWRREIQAKNEEIESLRDQYKQEHNVVQHSPADSGSVTVASVSSTSPDDHGVRFAFSCIERSLPLIAEELQLKISELEEKLLSERQAKQELENECESLKARVNSTVPVTFAKHTQFDNGENLNFVGMEQLTEEKTRLNEQLISEQKKCQELNEEILRLKSNEVISVPLKMVQNHTANGTSLENAELPNSASSSSVSPTATKPRNKNKKKKATSSN